MGSPQYGGLILDGKPFPASVNIEFQSLVWANDGRLLAVQELVDWGDGPTTRVVVIDADGGVRLCESPAEAGLSNPIRFEAGALVYKHWHHSRGEQELRLEVSSHRA